MLFPLRFAASRLGAALESRRSGLFVTWAGRSVEVLEHHYPYGGAFADRRAATTFHVQLATPLQLGLRIERGHPSEPEYSLRRGTPTLVALDDARLAGTKVRAIDHEATRALLAGGLADALLASQSDVVDVHDHVVQTGAWGSVVRPSTLRKALDAATRIATCIERLSLAGAASWRSKALSAMESLAVNTVDAGTPFRSASSGKERRLVFDRSAGKARGEVDGGFSVEVAAILHRDRPTTEIVFEHASPESLPPLFAIFTRRAFVELPLPPGPGIVPSGDTRFDARWMILTGGPPGPLPPGMELAMRAWVLEAIDARSPIEVSLSNEAAKLTITILTESALTDAGTLARELDAWTDFAQRFVSPAA